MLHVMLPDEPDLGPQKPQETQMKVVSIFLVS